MKDKLLDFIENHRKLVIFGLVAVVLIIVLFVIRSNNLKKKAQSGSEPTVTITEAPQLEQDVAPTKKPSSAYESSLGIGTGKDKVDRVEVVEPTKPAVTPTEAVELKPSFDVDVEIWGWTNVPKKNQDGSSCKKYLESVKLSDFGTMWGTKLTEADFKSLKRHMVGVEQNPNGKLYGDLQSVGWLIENLETLDKNDAVRFTNLHVIGHLSDTHVALLCSYDWYSAHGLKDTLVVFEDISNTLKVEDFKDGDIFSATVFVHNIRVVPDVKGQRVVVVQYAKYR